MARTPLASALMLYVNQKYEACVTKCTDILLEDPQNEAAWLLKTRSLTKLSDPLRQVSIEDDSSFDPSLNSARLPVSFRSETSLVGGLIRPLSARPSTSNGRPATAYMLQKYSSRGIHSSQKFHPVTSSREPDQHKFIEINSMNLRKISTRPEMATALFEYTFHVLKNIPKALELAAIAAQTSDGREWWWRLQVGKCKMHLKDYREAERVLKSSLQIQVAKTTELH
ncbi:Tetratricopeptide repeat protein 8 [Entophlyctis luteolus]|nr:Tetratricopeptide repeat protein 8 [Entophlyctis luteolus]